MQLDRIGVVVKRFLKRREGDTCLLFGLTNQVHFGLFSFILLIMQSYLSGRSSLLLIGYSRVELSLITLDFLIF